MEFEWGLRVVGITVKASNLSECTQRMNKLGGGNAHREDGPRKPEEGTCLHSWGLWEKIDQWGVAEHWNLFEVRLSHFDVAAAIKWGT